MFNFFNKAKNGEKLELKIDGMHCTSCSMNIDGELEDLDGVIDASTSYAKATSIVTFDPTKTDKKKIVAAIEKTGYRVV